MKYHSFYWMALLSLFGLATPLSAQLVGTVPATGKVMAYAGSTRNGTTADAGPNFFTPLSSPFNSEIKSFTNSGWAIAGTAFSNGVAGVNGLNSSARGTLILGRIAVRAENATPNNNQSPAGVVNAGWDDTFSISASGRQGTGGYLLIDLEVLGGARSAGTVGTANLAVVAAKDGVFLLRNAFGYSMGSSDPIQTDLQYVQWSLSSFATTENVGRAITDHVTFSIPFTFGQSFRLSIYGRALAGVRSSVSDGGASQSKVYGHIRWLGINSVTDRSGVAITGYTLLSASGLSWAGPPAARRLPVISRMTRTASGPELSWPSIEDQEFQVEQTSNFAAWSPLPETVRATSGTTILPIGVPPGDKQRFFRVWLDF